MGNEENSEIELIVQEELECCIGGCCSRLDSSFKVTEKQLQSFHRIPKQPGLRQTWVNIIRASRAEPEWFPEENSSVCSIHFHPADLSRLRNGDENSGGNIKNLVPALRLTGSLSFGCDEEIQIIKDSGVPFPFQVKEEPKSEEEKEEEQVEDPSSSSLNSRYWKKPGQRPKPTWSLKELWDDDGEDRQNVECSESSDYEPSGSDSDSDKERRSGSKRQKLYTVNSNSAANPGSRSESSTPPHTALSQVRPLQPRSSIQQNQTRRRRNQNRRYTSFRQAFGDETLKVVNSPLTQQKKVPMTLPVLNGGPVANHSNLVDCVEQLQNIHRQNVNNTAADYAKSDSIFRQIYAQLRSFKSNELTRTLLYQVDMLSEVICRRKREGNCIASQVHFTLVSKKLIEILKSCSLVARVPSSKKPQSSDTPRRKLHSSDMGRKLHINQIRNHNISAPVTNYNRSLPASSYTGHNLVLQHQNLPRNQLVMGNVGSQQSTKDNESKSSPEVVTLDDDEEEVTPMIKSVTTLSAAPAGTSAGPFSAATLPPMGSSTPDSPSQTYSSSPICVLSPSSPPENSSTPPSSCLAVTSSSAVMSRFQGEFDVFVSQILAMESPRPAPDSQVKNITWMGYPTNEDDDLDDDDWKGQVIPFCIGNSYNYPPGKYPPNIVLILDDAITQFNPIPSRAGRPPKDPAVKAAEAAAKLAAANNQNNYSVRNYPQPKSQQSHHRQPLPIVQQPVRNQQPFTLPGTNPPTTFSSVVSNVPSPTSVITSTVANIPYLKITQVPAPVTSSNTFFGNNNSNTKTNGSNFIFNNHTKPMKPASNSKTTDEIIVISDSDDDEPAKPTQAVQSAPSCPSTVITVASTPSTVAATPSTVASTPSTIASTPSTVVSTPLTVVSTPLTVPSIPSTVASTPPTSTFMPSTSNYTPPSSNFVPSISNFNPPNIPSIPSSSFNAPKQNFHPPNPNFISHNQNFNPPNLNFNPPNSNFNSPHPNFNPPHSNFNSPHSNYNSPHPSYNSTHSNYNSPNMNFNPPNPNFHHPNPNFLTPNPIFNSPNPNFNLSNTNFNTPNPNFNLSNPNFNSPNPNLNFNHPIPNFNPPNPNFNHPIRNFNHPMSNFNSPNSFTPSASSFMPTSSLAGATGVNLNVQQPSIGAMIDDEFLLGI